MKHWKLTLALILIVPAIAFAKADGAWLRKVPQADHAKTNPYADSPEAAAAGRNLFVNNCAKCHGEHAEGKGSRPSLRSERIALASDGDLAWIVKNGNPWRGMPGWGGLPEQERWQIVTYLRSLNSANRPAAETR